MDYEIKLSDDKTFIIINVKKSLTPDIALVFTKESIELAAKHQISCFLIDVRGIENDWGVSKTYKFAQELGKYGRQRLDKVALLIDQEDRSHSFLETAVINQGYNNHLFTDYDEAVAWFGI